MADITMSPDKLMEQAIDTAHHYMVQGEKRIDGHFGKGYAKENPALLTAFMAAAAQDFGTAVLRVSLQEIRDSLSIIARRGEE